MRRMVRAAFLPLLVMGLASCGEATSWERAIPEAVQAMNACSAAYQDYRSRLADYQVYTRVPGPYTAESKRVVREVDALHKRAFATCDFENTIAALTRVDQQQSSPLRGQQSKCVEDLASFHKDEVIHQDVSEGFSGPWERAFDAEEGHMQRLFSCRAQLVAQARAAGLLSPEQVHPVAVAPASTARPATSVTDEVDDVPLVSESQDVGRKVDCNISIDGSDITGGGVCIVEAGDKSTSYFNTKNGCVLRIDSNPEGGFTAKLWSYRNICPAIPDDGSEMLLGEVVPSSALVNCWSNERVDACLNE